MVPENVSISLPFHPWLPSSASVQQGDGGGVRHSNRGSLMSDRPPSHSGSLRPSPSHRGSLASERHWPPNQASPSSRRSSLNSSRSLHSINPPVTFPYPPKLPPSSSVDERMGKVPSDKSEAALRCTGVDDSESEANSDEFPIIGPATTYNFAVWATWGKEKTDGRADSIRVRSSASRKSQLQKGGSITNFEMEGSFWRCLSSFIISPQSQRRLFWDMSDML